MMWVLQMVLFGLLFGNTQAKTAPNITTTLLLPPRPPIFRPRFSTGGNITLESQLLIPPAPAEEISRLLSERIAYRLVEAFGFRPPHLKVPIRRGTTRPRRVDWRLRWNVPWLATIQEQGGCGSCWAFAVAALVESMTRIEHGIWAKRSEGDVRDGSLRETTVDDWCAQGADYFKALFWVAEHGIVDPKCWPYTFTNNRVTGYYPCGDRAGRTVRIPFGVTNLGTNVENQKDWLDKTGPIITNMDVPDAFHWHHGTGVYTTPASGPGSVADSKNMSQHVVLAVGYDDDLGAWLIRNQWGTGWGDNGYGWIAYGEMNMDNVWEKVGLQSTDPDPWSMRRHHNGNMIVSGRTGSSHKHLEIVACARNGAITHWVRAGGELGDFSWTSYGNVGTWLSPFPPYCVGQPALTATTRGERIVETLYLNVRGSLENYAYDPATGIWTHRATFGDGKISGYPSLIQFNGGQGLACVVRHQDGSLRHYERSSSTLNVWKELFTITGKGVRMSGASLVQANVGYWENYYTVAVMDDSTMQLFWLNRDAGVLGWERGENFGWLIGKTPPVMIQTNYATSTENDIGDFEVFVMFGGKVLRYWRDNSDLRAGASPLDFADTTGKRWTVVETFRSPDGDVKHVWSALQGPFEQNLEVVIELEDGRMQTMFHDWGTNSWMLSLPAGGSVAV